MKPFMFFLAFALFFAACNTGSSTKGTTDTATEETPAEPEMTAQAPAANMQMVANLRNALKADLLKDDLANIPAENRKFSLAEADLTGDGKNEYLVGFQNSYFCGSGGCTFMLLDHEGNQITRFSVSRAPFYVMPTKTNGMNDLLVFSNGSMRQLVFNGTTYPSNPSTAPVYNEEPGAGWTKMLMGEGKDQSFDF